MEPVTFRHPRPLQDRLIQIGALVVVVLLVLSAPLQALLTLLGAPAGFVLSALATLLMALPVLMLTAQAPAVTVNAEGITLHPVVWRDRAVPWESIQAVKVYPLLPAPEQEVNRRIAVGRLNYRPADGIMLVIPDLPPQYRITGFFAGERAAPVVALTNRAHAGYDRLLEAVLRCTDPTIHDPALRGQG